MKKVLSLILVVAMIAAMGIVTASAEVAVHTSYDVVQTVSGTQFIFGGDPNKLASATGVDDIGDVTSSVVGVEDALFVSGWHAANGDIQSFGYSINGKDVVWVDASVVEPVQAVIDAATQLGASDVNNFVLTIPFASGDVSLKLYAKTSGEAYEIWEILYSCGLDFSVIKEINFDNQADSDFTNTIDAPLMSDSNFASFIRANYKIADGALVVKDYADIRWWGLNLVPTSDYMAAEYEFSAESLASLTFFSVNDANDASQATSNQGDGGKLILVGPGEEGKLNVYDNKYNNVATIDANKAYTLTAILEVGTQNYYIAIDGVRLDVTCEYPAVFTAVGGMRVDLAAKEEGSTATSIATYDDITLKNCDLTDYPKAGEEVPSQKPSGGNADTADNTAIVFMIAAAAVVVTVLLKKRAY
jgi:hypothetical protein